MESDTIVLENIDYHEEIVPIPEAVYYARVSGDTLEYMGFKDDDLLLIDRSKDFSHGCKVMLWGKDKFLIRQVNCIGGDFYIMPLKDESFAPVKATPENYEKERVWGVISFIIRKA